MRPAVRLDAAVAARTGITRSQARSLIMEGRVRLNGSVVTKAGHQTPPSAAIEVERPRRFVSRGGEKLEGALEAFGVSVESVVALDVGASTGGFTDCLLQHGAAHVTAVDVGYGQLDWRLRNDPRVTVIERTNVRLLPVDAFADRFDFMTVDVSFISAATVLATARAFLRNDATAIVLVKPQFEAGRARVGDGGVVRDAGVHRAVLHEMRAAFAILGLTAVALCESPLRGPAGNREFFMQLARDGTPFHDDRIDAVVSGGF